MTTQATTTERAGARAVCDRGDWFVEWPSGWRAFMPSEAVARRCAASDEIEGHAGAVADFADEAVRFLERIAERDGDNDYDECLNLRESVVQLRAALAKAKPQ